MITATIIAFIWMVGYYFGTIVVGGEISRESTTTYLLFVNIILLLAIYNRLEKNANSTK